MSMIWPASAARSGTTTARFLLLGPLAVETRHGPITLGGRQQRIVLTLLLFWKHSENIKRLQAGTEGRIGA